jgi:S-adenosylmethionine uptake transporter
MSKALTHDHSAGPIVMACLGVLLLTSLDGVAKELSTRHPTIDVVAIRYVSGVFWSSLVALLLRPPLPNAAMFRAHSVRAVFFALTSYLFFFALAHLPMVETMVVTFVSPIFMALFGRLILGEKVHPATAFAIIVSFTGVLITASGQGMSLENFAENWLGVCAALGSAGTYALSGVLLRARSGSDPLVTIVVLQNVLTATIVIPVACVFGDPLNAVMTEWPLVLGIGALGTAGQFAMATALRAAPAARIGVVDYTSLIWATVIGTVFFAEWPEQSVYFGGALIMSASFLLLRGQNRPLPLTPVEKQ